MRVYRITKNKTNEPEEAFVVRKFSDKCYQLLYTDDERVRKSNMLQTSSEWGMLEKGDLHVNRNPITTLSDY